MPINPASIKILIVSKSGDESQFLKEQLLAFNFSQCQAVTPELFASKTQCNVLLINCDFPSKEYLGILDQAKAQNAHVYFLYDDGIFDVKKAFHHGVDGVFKKPYSVSNLIASIRNALLPWQNRLSLLPSATKPPVANLVFTDQQATAAQLAFGRMGFSFTYDKTLGNISDNISFEFPLQDGGHVKGRGYIRWKQVEGTIERYGIEYILLEKPSQAIMDQWLQKNKPKSTIPAA